MKKTMSFEEFRQALVKEIRLLNGNDVEMRETTVVKDNDVLLHGVILRRRGQNIGITLYFNPYYEEYRMGRTIGEIAQELERIYLENDGKRKIEVEKFKDFEYVKDKVVYDLINYETNKERLENRAYIRILDMAMVLYFCVCDENGDELNWQIEDRHLSGWKVEREELFKRAISNTERLKPLRFMSIEEIMLEMVGLHPEYFPEEEKEMLRRESRLYVLTNHNNIKGAGVMLYPGELKRIAEELESDLVVFPSSIHETIIYPLSEVCELEGLKGMVRYANGTFVNKQEILSDRVYLYKRQENRLCLAFPEEGVEAVELDRLFEVKLYVCEKAERVVA